MTLQFNALTAILGIVISQSIFAAGLLISSKKNKLPNRILSLLLIAISLWLVDNFMRIGMIYRQYPNLYFLPIFYSLGFGPLIYFYVRSLINQHFKFRPIHLLHFLPVFVQACLYLILSCCDYATKAWYWEHIHRPYTYRIEFDGTWISLMIYLILSFNLLQKYQIWLRDHFSELSKLKLNWLRLILALMILLCAQWLIEIVLRDAFSIYFAYDYSLELLGIMSLTLGISGIKQTNLSALHFELESSTKNTEPRQLAAIDQQIVLKITEAMEVKQLYLQPNLSLEELAEHLKIPQKIVSRHINEAFQQSFNDYVNGFRIEAVKRRFKTGDLEKLSILGIALECGFNSKSTFNRTFKELTGKSPSQYLS